jgi:hypothetical protein
LRRSAETLGKYLIYRLFLEKMQEKWAFKALEKTLSSPRLGAYRLSSADTDELVLRRYAWNIALSEALYSVLKAVRDTAMPVDRRGKTSSLGKNQKVVQDFEMHIT